MSTVTGLLLIVLAALVQVAVVPEFSLFGAQPNVLIVLLVAWMAVRGQREALVLVPAAGFVLGLLDSQPLGLAMLALSPLIVLSEVREWRLVESDLLPALLCAALATLAFEGVMLLTLVVTGDRVGWRAGLLDVLVPAVIANVLLLLPVYALVRLASFDLRRRPMWAT